MKSGSPYEDMYGYCRAVRVDNTIHVAGTTAVAPNIEGCDAYVQAKAALAIIDKSLSDLDATLNDVVRTVTYIVDRADTELVAKAHFETFGDIRPAATLVVVAGLIDPSLLVEIEAYAIAAG